MAHTVGKKTSKIIDSIEPINYNVNFALMLELKCNQVDKLSYIYIEHEKKLK